MLNLRAKPFYLNDKQIDWVKTTGAHDRYRKIATARYRNA